MSDMSIEIPQQPVTKKRSNAVFRLPNKLAVSPEMLADDWIDTVQKKCREVYYRSLSDPRLYACGKLAERFLVGTGVLLRSGQSPTLPAGNTTIYQNIKIYMSMSQEEKEKAIELHRQATLAGADSGTGSVASYGVGATEDQERPALVAAELHQDV